MSVNRFRNKPFGLLLVTLGLDALGFVIVHNLTHGHSAEVEVEDLAFFLTVIAPSLYFLLYRPMAGYFKAMERGRIELSEANNLLNERVRERTQELEKLNNLLREEYTEALSLSEERYKSVINSLGVGVFVINPGREILITNNQIKNWFPNLDYAGKLHCYDLFAEDPKSGKCRDCPLPLTLQDGKTRKVARQRVVGGKNRSFKQVISPIIQQDGNIIAVTILSEDVTEQKIQEEQINRLNETLESRMKERTAELLDARNRYRSLVQQSSEGIFIFVPATRAILEANKKLASMLGYTEKEISQMKLEDIAAMDPAQINVTLDKVVQGETSEDRLRYKRKDGTWLVTESSFSIVKYGNSRVCLVNVRDVTERDQAEKALKHNVEKLKHTVAETVNALALVIEKRDPYTAGHMQRVAKLASAIASKMGFSEQQVEGISVAAKLIDIGKIYVPADILNKPGKLTDMEMGMIRTHPQIGHEILQRIPFEYPVADIVLEHHERLNGSGYPGGLAGNDILLEARIIAVADVVEAMMSHRPYRPAAGLDLTMGEISRNKGILYDSQVVDVCLELCKSGWSWAGGSVKNLK